MSKFTPISVHDLGDYLREQRHSARLSLRQLSAVAGISNPYLSQIERGLKKPSAEILQALAKALRISAESLYVRAGFLDERTGSDGAERVDVTEAILAEPRLNDRQRAVLLDVYESFVGGPTPVQANASRPSELRPVTTLRRIGPSQQAKTSTIKQASKTSKTSKTQRTSTNPTQQSNPKEKQS